MDRRTTGPNEKVKHDWTVHHLPAHCLEFVTDSNGNGKWFWVEIKDSQYQNYREIVFEE